MAFNIDRPIPSMHVNPNYLRTNSQSHASPLSAFAELIDNSYDAQANHLFIENKFIKKQECVLLKDDGNGLDRDRMVKMMSLGFTEKPESNLFDPIGRYGNGFKSGSLRLGDDVLIFSKTINGDCTIGFLSLTYNEKIQNNTTPLIPIVSLNQKTLVPDERDESSLKVILKNSLFTREDLSDIFSSNFKTEDTKNEFGFYNQTQGTIILIYNLRKLLDKENILELDLKSDPNDIKLNRPETDSVELDTRSLGFLVNFNSLREYVQLLYLSLNKTLKHDKKSALTIKIGKKYIEGLYDSQFNKQKLYQFKANLKNATMIIGQTNNTNKLSSYNTFIYHKNRLIECLDKTKCKSEFPKEVKSIVIADFLIPTHFKQSFERNEDFIHLKNQILSYEKRYLNENYPKNLSTDFNQTKISPSVQSSFEKPGFNNKQQPNKFFPANIFNSPKNTTLNSFSQKCPSGIPKYTNELSSLIRQKLNEKQGIDRRIKKPNNNSKQILKPQISKQSINIQEKKNMVETTNPSNQILMEDIIGEISSSSSENEPNNRDLNMKYNDNISTNFSLESSSTHFPLENISKQNQPIFESTSFLNRQKSIQAALSEHETQQEHTNHENQLSENIIVETETTPKNDEELSIRDLLADTYENNFQNTNSPESEYISADESDLDNAASNKNKEPSPSIIKRENIDHIINDIKAKKIKTEPISNHSHFTAKAPDIIQNEATLEQELSSLYEICLKHYPRIKSIPEFIQQFEKCKHLAKTNK